MAAKLMVEIVGEATSAVSAFKKTEAASKEAGTAAQGTTKSFAGIAKGVATGMAVGAVVKFGKSTVEAAQESEVAHQRLLTVFKGVGGGAEEATAAAEKYATSLSKATGIDDELISGAQAILATFHSVSGEVGQTSGMFDRATGAAADLAAAGFGSLEGNATALGKALEDPTKGMTALARSGVTFTKQQKDQIKAMQESGDLLGAQEIVMAAVEGQVKGTAEATATSTDKMKVAWGNFQESVGAALLPFIDTIATKFASLFEFVSANSSWLVPLVGAIAALVAGLLIFVETVKVITAVTKAWKLAQMALNKTFLASPITWIILGIIALVAVVVLIATKTTWFQRIWHEMTKAIGKAWDVVTGAISAAWNAVWGVIEPVIGWIQDAVSAVFNWIKENWPLLVGILFGPFGIAVALIITYWDQVSAALSAFFDWLGGAVSAVGEWLSAPFIAAWGFITTAWDAAVGFFSGLWSSINAGVQAVLGYITAPFSAAWAAVTAVWDAAVGFFTGIVSGIGSTVAGIASTVSAPFVAAWNAIYSGLISPLSGAFSGIVSAITSALSGVTNAITAPFKAAWEWINSNVLGPLKSAWNGVANAINSVHIEMNIPDAIPGLPDSFTFDPPNVPTLAAGGILTRTGLVLAHAGEVISPVPTRLRGRGDGGPLVRIEHAHFDEKVDIDTFGQRLAWQVSAAGV